MIKIIKILFFIFIAGCWLIAGSMFISHRRMRDRDYIRIHDTAQIKLALKNYFKTASLYPVSSGECLTPDSGVGSELIEAKEIYRIPFDPLWPAAGPERAKRTAGYESFCYFYFSNSFNEFSLSFFLEANSRAGGQGVNILRP